MLRKYDNLLKKLLNYRDTKTKIDLLKVIMKDNYCWKEKKNIKYEFTIKFISHFIL